MKKYFKILCITLLATSTVACGVYGNIPASVIDHAAISCSVHGGIEEFQVTVSRMGDARTIDGGENSRSTHDDKRTYCSKLIVVCKDDFTELSYDICDKKWYPKRDDS